MHFIFGYCREVAVKIETNPSKIALVGLAVLIISLLILLSFENLEKDTSIPPTILEPSPSLDRLDEATLVEEIRLEKGTVSPEENAELMVCQTKEV